MKPSPPPKQVEPFPPGLVLKVAQIAEHFGFSDRKVRQSLPPPDIDWGTRSKRWFSETVNKHLIKDKKGAKSR